MSKFLVLALVLTSLLAISCGDKKSSPGGGGGAPSVLPKPEMK